MKQLVTMGTAIILCLALFIILKPLAASPTFEEKVEPFKQTEQTEQAAEKEEVSGNYVDKIAEFPILPEQREKLQMLQQERQESIKGMEPSQIEVPSIGVKANIEPTGILDNGQMGVPEDVDQVGWFEPGFKAGAKGHAVLAGHVDSLTGPAVFYELQNVKVGETVILKDADGREMVFEVKNLTSYETDEAPVEEIFGNSDKRMINLITCTGDFNRDIGSHEERLVVTAELISDSDTKEVQPEPPTNVTATAFNLSWYAVRDDAIIGYRIYEEDIATGEMKKIETVSLFDRKKVELTTDDTKRYFVTSVDVDLNESEKAEAEVK
ncbi:Peptidase C60 sortase A and B [Planococcus antarcticus DSM 14505]|uniref:Peptidase C60 sortase A and B n=1 Tax=Planococcus antarcticus DSM 14505 TaxID=1185653 RepID=A0AA87LV88_9BACL|nr:class F sortase [Planococcus antarcticus]EIM08202.1 Peptidase C60 sortase A and B [Planococcus antarcticus DSM 14505]